MGHTTIQYTSSSILHTLKDHFEDKGYKVQPYDDLFRHVRVPLHCVKEEQFFNWNNVPGTENERFLTFIKKEIGISWDIHPKIEINITGDKITVSDNKNKVVLTKKYDDVVEIKKSDGAIYNFDVKKLDDERIIFNNHVKIIDITTERCLNKKLFFSDIPVKDTTLEDHAKAIIPDASHLRFYRYYFPYSEIYLAYPGDAENEEKEEFIEFKDLCSKYGIGLLKVSDSVEEKGEARTLLKEMYNEIVKSSNIEKEIIRYHEDYTRYLVFYPEPTYKRRIITKGIPQFISLYVIDKIQELLKVDKDYSDVLIPMAKDFRNETRDDYDIAIENMKELWKKRLGLEYPEIHKNIEEILHRDESYREHFVHQYQVFLIGLFIIDKLYEQKVYKNVLLRFNKKYKCLIEDVWLAASTYHDFNYGIQKFNYWMHNYFSDTLYISDEEAMQNISILNLDAIMVREFLTDKIREIIDVFKLKTEKNKRILKKYLYEKAVKEKNHGILSALSLLKLYENQIKKRKIDHSAILEAAVAIACHDEDIWEALSRCKGYLRDIGKCVPADCRRRLSHQKQIEIDKQKKSNSAKEIKCEKWEQEVMKEEIIKNIEFKSKPVMFLLILCDSIQDEGRVKGTESIKKEYLLNGKRKKIEISSDIIEDWAYKNKRLEEIEKKNEITNIIENIGFRITENAQIYKHRLYNDKWKIVDENNLYILEQERNNIYKLRKEKKECTINDISIDSKDNNIVIGLEIDGIEEKLKELRRVAWVLNDKHFKINMEEKSTDIRNSIEINGRGG